MAKSVLETDFYLAQLFFSLHYPLAYLIPPNDIFKRQLFRDTTLILKNKSQQQQFHLLFSGKILSCMEAITDTFSSLSLSCVVHIGPQTLHLRWSDPQVLTTISTLIISKSTSPIQSPLHTFRPTLSISFWLSPPRQCVHISKSVCLQLSSLSFLQNLFLICVTLSH